MRKRLRILWAVITQEWHTFRCPGCSNELYVCGHAPDMRGLLCEECEGREYDKWYADFLAKDKQGAI